MLNKLFITLLFLGLPFSAVAAEMSLSDVIKTLETPFNSKTDERSRITDFSAEFSQQSHVTSINRVQHGAGSVGFRFIPATEEQPATAQFRWDYQTPDIQEIISDGRTMWVYLPDNKQVIESDLSRLNEDQGENPVTFLSGLGNLSRDFDIDWGTGQKDPDGHYLLQLRPKRPSQLIDQMSIVVNRAAVNDWLEAQKTGDKFPIIATIVTDFQGNRTSIRFEKVKLNTGLKGKLFHFDKPDDVELVRRNR